MPDRVLNRSSHLLWECVHDRNHNQWLNWTVHKSFKHCGHLTHKDKFIFKPRNRKDDCFKCKSERLLNYYPDGQPFFIISNCWSNKLNSKHFCYQLICDQSNWKHNLDSSRLLYQLRKRHIFRPDQACLLRL